MLFSWSYLGCSYLLDLNQAPQSTLPQLFLKVGEPLWIRCKAIHVNHGFGLTWELGNKVLEEVMVPLVFKASSQRGLEAWTADSCFINTQGSYFEMSSYSTNRSMIRILLAFVSSVGRNNTGYYTCSSSKHPSQSALVTILGNRPLMKSGFCLLLNAVLEIGWP